MALRLQKSELLLKVGICWKPSWNNWHLGWVDSDCTTLFWQAIESVNFYIIRSSKISYRLDNSLVIMFIIFIFCIY